MPIELLFMHSFMSTLCTILVHATVMCNSPQKCFLELEEAFLELSIRGTRVQGHASHVRGQTLEHSLGMCITSYCTSWCLRPGALVTQPDNLHIHSTITLMLPFL